MIAWRARAQETASVQLNTDFSLVTLALDHFSEYVGARDELDAD